MQLFTEIVNVRLGFKYASVIINLMSTSATQLYSKTTKINEIFIGVPHFILKLGQKLRNKFHHGDNTNISPWFHLSEVLFDSTQKQIYVK